MTELKNLVADLEQENDESQQIECLKKIGKELLKKRLKVDDVIIEPLWIEAYYYNEKKGFIDESVHRNDQQKDKFCELYFHHSKGDQRSGVDICLSNGDYYLSYLLKYTLVDGNFTTQSKLHDKIFDKYSQNKSISILDKNIDNQREIAITQRVGINNSSYRNERLAFVPINLIKEYPFDNKENIVKSYIDDYFCAEREKMCIELLGYRSKFVLGK